MTDVHRNLTPAERAELAGCPVISLDTAYERPVGEWMGHHEALRDRAPIFWNENGTYWIVTRGAMAREIMQNPQVFTNDSISPSQPDPPYKWIPSNINPPLHVQYRQILNHAFNPAAVARIAEKTREYCRAAIDRFVDRGRCDVMTDFAGVFPTQVFLEIVDLPAADAPTFVGWAERIFDGLARVSGGTLEDALDFYTRGSAYAEFAETAKGTLEQGRLADVVVFARDLFAVEPRAILDTPVDLTIVGGRIVFERGSR